MSCDVNIWKVHYQLHSCALKYLMKLGEGEEEKEEEEGENEDLTAIAEVVGCGKQLPLGGVVYRPVRRWVRGVLGRDSEEEGDTQSEGDAVLQLIQRVIAEAEEEVALETVARGDTAMETDKGPNMVSITSAVTSTARAGLLEQCLYGVAVCSVRCPAYYKSLYRLASTLHSLGQSEVGGREGKREGGILACNIFHPPGSPGALAGTSARRSAKCTR